MRKKIPAVNVVVVADNRDRTTVPPHILPKQVSLFCQKKILDKTMG